MKKGARYIGIAIITVGLTYFGFKYGSGWAFFGAIIAFFSFDK